MLDELIDKHVSIDPTRDNRAHLGGSLIPHDCPRWVWLTWHWSVAPITDPKRLRIFDDGHAIEAATIERMESFCSVETRPGGEQIGGSMTGTGGHVQFHLDNIISGIPGKPGRYLLEVKSASQTSFKKLLRVESYEEWNPQYFGQIQFYLGALGEQGDELDGAFALIYNKNDGSYYSEFIEFDYAKWSGLKARALFLLEARTPPDREYSRSFYKAKNFMSADDYGVYFQDLTPLRSNCRNCVFSRIKTDGDNGAWGCALHKKSLSYADQLAGCDRHLWIPELVPGELIEISREGASYESKRGSFTNGKDHLPSNEISFLTRTNPHTEKAYDFDALDQLRDIRKEFPNSDLSVEPITKKPKDQDSP